jgi:hypothetical protein
LTLMTIAENPDAACLNPLNLLPIVLATGKNPMIAPIDRWLTGMCASQACSNNTISGVVTNLTNACASDFKLPPQSQISQTVATVQRYYATARKVSCLAG